MDFVYIAASVLLWGALALLVRGLQKLRCTEGGRT